VQANKSILVGGMIIIGVGVIRAATQKKPETPVLAGGVAFLLIASLLDALGPGPSKVATALVALAATTVVITEIPSVYSASQSVISKAKSAGA